MTALTATQSIARHDEHPTDAHFDRPAARDTRKPPVDVKAVALLKDLAALPADDARRATVRDRAIQAWLPLARHLAQRFNGRGEPLDDLVQIATVGLIKAIDRFNPEYGNDFAAYAVPTVVGEIKRHFRDRTWDVRVPRRLQELKLDINEATSTLSQRLGRSPTVADIAEHLKRSEDEVLEGLEGARAYSAVSLQSLVGNGEDGTELGDLFGVEDHELALAEHRASLGPALEALSPREQKIVILRFFGNLTQTQIAERVGISQMHVSRMLAKSLATMRDHLANPA
ncbi:RNA polymerase sigma factor SigF [Rugosimonospora africana]|uniref:RNA polymerase sigma factor n=1 Tax=Rugosimonospora africana TaxID=556532 RepID=A0A8J3QM05_9ACTN|nr:RNA polymerase sigma factor SigF [Rugosimonospora africana]GIH11918.1 RNA polymerase sigma factor [Rugosimonospora africana]